MVRQNIQRGVTKRINFLFALRTKIMFGEESYEHLDK